MNEQDVSKKTVTASLKEYLSQLSKYAYFEDINFILSRNSRLLTVTDTETAILLGEVTVSDSLVLEIIEKYSWVNPEMVLNEVSLMKSKEPIKAYPAAKQEVIKACLARLAKTGLVRVFEYNSITGNLIKLYCLSENGSYYLRKRMLSTIKHETFNSLNAMEEIFKRIASNYVGQSLARYKGIKKFIPGSWDYIQGVGKVFIYSRLETEVNGIEHIVIVEPCYILSNPKIISESKMKDIIQSRIAMVKKIIEDNVDKQVSVICVVEDLAGLKYATNLFLSEVPDNIHNFYFTSENCIFQMKQATNAFLRIKNSEMKKNELTHAKKLEFLLYSDDIE